MSHQISDLAQYPKKIRSKLRLAIYMGRILDLIYFAVRSKYRGELRKYDSFQQFISDTALIKKIIGGEVRSGGSQAPFRYIEIVRDLCERGYTGLISIAELIWDLTVHNRKIHHKDLFYKLLGLETPLNFVKLRGQVFYRPYPFRMYASRFRFFIIEAELMELSRVAIYISSLAEDNRSIGLFAKIAIDRKDAERLLEKQHQGFIPLVTKRLPVYPTLLRMQRISYTKVIYEERLNEEMRCLLSEIYVDENELDSIINMKRRANIFTMIPLPSLRGGLCFPVAFLGELEGDLDLKARVRVDGISLRASPAYYSVLSRRSTPGEYLFIAGLPFSMPKVALVIATLPASFATKIVPRRRNVTILDKLFPTVEEALQRRI